MKPTFLHASSFRWFLTCGLFFMASHASAQTLYPIPDEAFRTFLEGAYPSAMNGGQLDIDAATQVSGAMDVSGQGIENLDGIQFFTGVESLNLSDNHLSYFDSFYALSLAENGALTSLDLSGNAIDVEDLSALALAINERFEEDSLDLWPQRGEWETWEPIYTGTHYAEEGDPSGAGIIQFGGRGVVYDYLEYDWSESDQHLIDEDEGPIVPGWPIFGFDTVRQAYAGRYVCWVSVVGVPEARFLGVDFTLVVGPSTPDWPVAPSQGETHIVVVPTEANVTIEDEPIQIGDYVGLFFEDESGELLASDTAMWTGESLALNAWGLLNETPKDGFADGEAFQFRIWRASDRAEFAAEAVYEMDAPFVDGFFSAFQISLVKGLSAGCDHAQTVELYAGWNLVSLNVSPQAPGFASVFPGSMADSVIVKDAAGTVVYAPAYGMESGAWDVGQGYKVFVTADLTLEVCGTPLDPQTPLSLQPQPYPLFLPYYGQEEAPAAAALAPLGEGFLYAQSSEYDESGRLNAFNYIPAHVIDPPIDQIGTLKPGLAYKLMLTETVDPFVYPEGVVMRQSGETERLLPQRFANVVSTDGGNCILAFPAGTFQGQAQAGDEIAVYANGTLSGAAVYDPEGFALTVWRNEAMRPGTDLEFRFWDAATGEEHGLEVGYSTGDGSYSPNALLIASQARVQRVTGIENGLNGEEAALYPNPTADRFNMRFSLQGAAMAELTVLDLSGRVLKRERLGRLEAGAHDLATSAENLPDGFYVCRVQAGSQTFTLRLAVRR